MSAEATHAEVRVPAGGTVFDIGYRNYAGAREGTKRSRLAVYKDGLRTALGIGRGPGVEDVIGTDRIANRVVLPFLVILGLGLTAVGSESVADLVGYVIRHITQQHDQILNFYDADTQCRSRQLQW